MFELENKPKNVEEAIKAGWRTAKEIYECSGVCRDTFNEFLSAVKKATSQKPNSSYAIDCITEKCITGAHNTKYYHPKVEEAFQLWLRKNAINAGGQRTEGSIIKQEIHDIVDNSEYKYTKEEICSICNVSHATFERFGPKVLSDRDFISAGSSHKKLYTESVLQKFQLWLRKNAINAGGQRTEGSIIKQEIHDIVDNSEYKYTKEEICSICNCSFRTFESFAPKELSDRDFISVGSSHKKLYTESVLQKFQLWLKKNAMNAGGQRTEGSIIKQDNQQDLFIGCIASKGTPAEKRSLAEHLMEMADQQELLEQTKQQNQKLQLENQTMKSTLQYDKVKGWYRWGDLKRQWKPRCDRLKKGNYEKIFYEAGLEYGKDYEEIVFNGCEFPTCMVSPTAVPKLISYLHIL